MVEYGKFYGSEISELGEYFCLKDFFSVIHVGNHGKKIFQTKIFTQLRDLTPIKFSFCVTLFIAYTSFKDLLVRNTLQ